MVHGKRYALKEQRCRLCSRLQWPSYEKVASGRHALPTLSDSCPCGRYQDQVEERFDLDATGSIDGWHERPHEDACWYFCSHHSMVGVDARLLNVMPAVRQLGFPVPHDVECRSLSLRDDEALSECGRPVTVLCDGPDGNTFSTEQRDICHQRPDDLVISDRRGRSLFTELHDHIGFAVQWRGVWEPLCRQRLATEAGASTTPDVVPDKSVAHGIRPDGQQPSQ